MLYLESARVAHVMRWTTDPAYPASSARRGWVSPCQYRVFVPAGQFSTRLAGTFERPPRRPWCTRCQVWATFQAQDVIEAGLVPAIPAGTVQW